MNTPQRMVVKVGGSLFDLPDLGERLASFLRTLKPAQVLLVPGGGAGVDGIRALDRRFSLGDAVAHDLALRVMNINARVLATLLSRVLGQRLALWPDEPTSDPALALRAGELICLDAHAFCTCDAAEAVPESWDVTSDSIAARAAIVFDVDELVLLKSVTLPAPYDWETAAAAGHVDPLFPRLARQLRCVRSVNLRAPSLSD